MFLPKKVRKIDQNTLQGNPSACKMIGKGVGQSESFFNLKGSSLVMTVTRQLHRTPAESEASEFPRAELHHK